MSSKVVVISEWLPESNQDETVFQLFKELARNTLGNEKGCLKYHVMRQVSHPCATGESKFSIVLIQEYTNTQAFDEHCQSEYVQQFAQKYLESNFIKDWRCRMFQSS